MTIPVFLTAYDPTDLPGGSVDPLGFEPGYLWLADQILPGITVAGSAPRYLSVLCAGISLADTRSAKTEQHKRARRDDAQQRFERLWAAANVLATDESEKRRLSGLRGVTYARAHLRSLARKGSRSIGADGWKLLTSQVPYGAVGIYAAVAAGMQLLDRKSLRLSVDLGEKLAKAFLDETDCPKQVRRAAVTGGEVKDSVLRAWGERAHVDGATGEREAARLQEALRQDSVRSRMAKRLEATPWMDGESELSRLIRVSEGIAPGDQDVDLQRAILTIRPFESGYQHVLLVLERALWLCRNNPAGPRIAWSTIETDEPLTRVRLGLPRVQRRLERTRKLLPASARLDAALSCIDAASSAGDNKKLVKAVVERHEQVQRDKRVRGRPKMPWVELDEDGASLTLTEVGGLRSEVLEPSQITTHNYRCWTADQLVRASHGA